MAPHVDSEKARPEKEKEQSRDPADLRSSEETVAEDSADNARVERTKSNGGVVGKVVSRPQVDHRTDGKVVLTEAEVYDELAVSFSKSCVKLLAWLAPSPTHGGEWTLLTRLTSVPPPHAARNGPS